MKSILLKLFMFSVITIVFASEEIGNDVLLSEESNRVDGSAQLDDRKLFSGIKDHFIDKINNRPQYIDYRPSINQLNSEINSLLQQIRNIASVGPNLLPAAQAVCTALTAGVTLTTLGTGKYYFSDTAMNWHAAQENCISKGMELVSLETTAENDLVKAEIARLFPGAVDATRMHWIGLNDLANTNTYIWTGIGVETTYRDFVLPNPVGLTFHCVGLIQTVNANTVKWDDTDCDTKSARFICELMEPCVGITAI